MVNLTKSDLQLEKLLKLKNSCRIIFCANKNEGCKCCIWENKKHCHGWLGEWQLCKNIKNNAVFGFQFVIHFTCDGGYNMGTKIPVLCTLGAQGTEQYLNEHFPDIREVYYQNETTVLSSE